MRQSRAEQADRTFEQNAELCEGHLSDPAECTLQTIDEGVHVEN